MRGRRGARIDVERHAQTLERALDEFMIAIHDLLGRDALAAGLDGDGHAVLVASADRNHVAALQPQVSRVDVRRNVYARQMPDVHRTVRIGKGRGDQVTSELFCHRIYGVSLNKSCQN